MQYQFEWDPAKARANRIKHGVSFEEAVTVFRDPRMLAAFDEEHSAQEDRWTTLAMASTGRVLVVCHTYRPLGEAMTAIRIISTRKATKRELTHYLG